MTIVFFFLQWGQGLNFHSRIAVSGDGAPEGRGIRGAARASGGDRATKTRGERRIASVPRVVEPRSPRERARLPRTAAAEKRILGISSARTPSALVLSQDKWQVGGPPGGGIVAWTRSPQGVLARGESETYREITRAGAKRAGVESLDREGGEGRIGVRIGAAKKTPGIHQPPTR